MTKEELNNLYLFYVAINQIHLEIIDNLSRTNVWRQKLKHHLKEASKIMEQHAEYLFENGNENEYIKITEFGDILFDAVKQKGYDQVTAILHAIIDDQIMTDKEYQKQLN